MPTRRQSRKSQAMKQLSILMAAVLLRRDGIAKCYVDLQRDADIPQPGINPQPGSGPLLCWSAESA
jgi:hypothetical protein